MVRAVLVVIFSRFRCFVRYVTLRPRFAVHAKQLAQLMMDPASTLHLLPMAWVGGVECAARTPVDVAASCIAKPPPKAPSAKDKWKQVRLKPAPTPLAFSALGGFGRPVLTSMGRPRDNQLLG